MSKKVERRRTLEFILSLMGGLVALVGFFITLLLIGSPYALAYLPDVVLKLFVGLILTVSIIIGSILIKIKWKVGSWMVVSSSIILFLMSFILNVPIIVGIFYIFGSILSIIGGALAFRK